MPKLDEDRFDLEHGIFHMLDRKNNLAEANTNDKNDTNQSGSPSTVKKRKVDKENAKPTKKPNIV